MSSPKVVITGGAGLVGQNLVELLSASRRYEIVVIDKHRANLETLRSLQPWVHTVHADLADPGDWACHFDGASATVVLHAQVTGKTRDVFERNNLLATERVLEASRRAGVPFIVHVSSSVVNSVVTDDYSSTKREQEALVLRSGIAACVLRPTLMFGWFDPKHLGWLGRFMEKVPVFPIPGHGRYARQPLYCRDFCRAIEWCLEHRPNGEIYDLTGPEHIDYIDIIRAIARVKGLRVPLVHLPLPVFGALLKLYARLSDHPPFTADQLVALTAGDDFIGVDMSATFQVVPTGFEQALRETLCDSRYAGVALEDNVA